jgi:hypothetical protein
LLRPPGTGGRTFRLLVLTSPRIERILLHGPHKASATGGVGWGYRAFLAP